MAGRVTSLSACIARRHLELGKSGIGNLNPVSEDMENRNGTSPDDDLSISSGLQILARITEARQELPGLKESTPWSVTAEVFQRPLEVSSVLAQLP